MSTHSAVTSKGLTPEQQRRADKRAWILKVTLFPLGLVAVLAIGTAIILSLHTNRKNPSTKPNATATLNTSSETNGLSNSINGDIVFTLRQTSFMIEVAKTQRAIGQLSTARTTWNDLFSATRTNDEGRRIASDPKLLVQFIVLDGIKRPDLTDEELTAKLNELLSQSKDVVERTAWPQLTAQVQELGEQARSTEMVHQTHHQVLTQLLELAKNIEPTATLSVAEAMAAREQNRQMVQQTRVDDAARNAEVRLAQEYKELVVNRDNASTKIVTLKEQLQQAKSNAPTQMLLNAEPKPDPALVKAYREDRASILAKLQPFITPGYLQPDTPNHLKLGIDKVAMSYMALRRVGALHDSKTGLETLWRMGATRANKPELNRPLGGFPQFFGPIGSLSPKDKSHLNEAQRLLRSYGPLLVADGLLQP